MAVILFVLVWIASTIYLAVALALCVALLMLVYWVFTQLPARFGARSDQQEPRRRGSR